MKCSSIRQILHGGITRGFVRLIVQCRLRMKNVLVFFGDLLRVVVVVQTHTPKVYFYYVFI